MARCRLSSSSPFSSRTRLSFSSAVVLASSSWPRSRFSEALRAANSASSAVRLSANSFFSSSFLFTVSLEIALQSLLLLLGSQGRVQLPLELLDHGPELGPLLSQLLHLMQELSLLQLRLVQLQAEIVHRADVLAAGGQRVVQVTQQTLTIVGAGGELVCLLDGKERVMNVLARLLILELRLGGFHMWPGELALPSVLLLIQRSIKIMTPGGHIKLDLIELVQVIDDVNTKALLQRVSQPLVDQGVSDERSSFAQRQIYSKCSTLRYFSSLLLQTVLSTVYDSHTMPADNCRPPIYSHTFTRAGAHT
ncbi:hypothetical protein EYF80_020582 [Liparis tanakae]|uniref:Uncharacterized protein n=1 Tax=Liparis tanakae TaxID=230148 RepID=A0A4Z2HVD9_9TELE|nr:hypothetical protein EYF80_020582 [Liparis tanakae]